MKTNLIYKSLLTLLLLTLFSSSILSQENNSPYKNPELPIDERVDDLLSRMTLQEKCEQLQYILKGGLVGETNGHLLKKVGSGFVHGVNSSKPIDQVPEKYNDLQKFYMEETRLGIPVLYSQEAEYALHTYGSTAFPQSLALASSWDPEVMRIVAKTISSETKASGSRLVFTPVINILSDPRWGRAHECYGEDPYLTSKMAVPYVKEWQASGCISCPKHFVANIGMDGRFSGPVHFSERILREYYFPAFKACFNEGGAQGVMSAYNTLNGIPCGTNKWLLTDILRTEWGFGGMVVSDGGAHPMIFDSHKTVHTKEELAVQGIEAGCDVDISGFNIYSESLLEAVNKGMIDEKQIDESVRRILEQKFKIGLFDNPYVNESEYENILDCDEHRQKTLEVARKCMVLLKNDNNILPLSKDIKSIAVLGPLADELFGTHYASYGRHEVTVLEGITKYLTDVEVNYEKGAEMYYYSIPPIQTKFLSTKENGKMVSGLKGEYFNNKNLEGEPVLTRIDKMIDFNWKEGSPHESINSDNFSVRWTGKLTSPKSGKYLIGASMDDGVRVYLDNELIIDKWTWGSKRQEAIKFDFEAGKTYDVKIEYYDGTYKASMIFGWHVDPFGQIPAALEAAKKSDVSVIVVGSYAMEGKDRAYLDLSASQEQLIIEVAKLNKPMVVLLHTGNVITIHDWIDVAPAIVETWYPGEEGGTAVAEMLFGDVNPSGKLPVTFPKTVGQVPIRYNRLPSDYKQTGVKISEFLGVGNEPEFPFGHGLSYTTFKYDNLKLSSNNIKPDGTVSVIFEITNTGKVAGEEVAQLYIHDEVASVAQPRKELQGFKKIAVNPGETKKVELKLTSANLKIWSINNKWEVEPGDFSIMIGSSSEDIRLNAKFTVVE